MAEQDTPRDDENHPAGTEGGGPGPDQAGPKPADAPGRTGGPRHALPDDMQPAQTPPTDDTAAAPQSSGPPRTAPAYESYEAPESNLMPITIAAIVGGLFAAVLLLRLLRNRDAADAPSGDEHA